MTKKYVRCTWYLIFFFKILTFGIIKGGVGKRAKNHPKWQKIMSVSLCISGTVHHILWFLVHMCKMMISSKFFNFSKFWFWGFFRGVKWQKITLTYQFQNVLLYISGTVDHIRIFLIMISTGVFLYFFEKIQHGKY